jgi:hypothetical protein
MVPSAIPGGAEIATWPDAWSGHIGSPALHGGQEVKDTSAEGVCRVAR